MKLYITRKICLPNFFNNFTKLFSESQKRHLITRDFLRPQAVRVLANERLQARVKRQAIAKYAGYSDNKELTDKFRGTGMQLPLHRRYLA